MPDASAQTLFMIFEGGMIGLASLVQVIVHPGPVFGSVWKVTSFFSKKAKREGTVTSDSVENGVKLTSGEKREALAPGAAREIRG